MNREITLTKLQIAAYGLNLIAVYFIAGTIAFSLRRFVEVMGARDFLDMVRVRPWKPEIITFVAMGSYMFLILLSGIGQLWEIRSKWVKLVLLCLEIVFCIAATIAMNMNYDGLVLLVVADMVRGQKGSRQKVILGVAIIALYTVVDYNLLGYYFGMTSWDTFITCFSTSAQGFLRAARSMFLSMNLVLFILYMAMLIRGEFAERERIQSLNAQLEAANERLKAYAVEAERNAETRERNRLAREIHDTLGHVLTGIVAGIDACITMIDISPEATKKQLNRIRDTARQGTTDVRRSVSKLRPDALEKMDLEEAIGKMLADFSSATKVDIRLDNQVYPLRFHEDEEEVIFRIIQEATTNSIRHGKADRIDIAITKKNQWLTIVIKDNGKGCPNIQSGFGLKHMEERLVMLNGRLEYDESHGFLIVASIPIRWGEEFSEYGKQDKNRDCR